MALLLGGYISRLKLAKLAVASKPGEKGETRFFGSKSWFRRAAWPGFKASVWRVKRPFSGI